MPKRRAELIQEIEQLLQQLTWRARRQFARRIEAVGLTVPQYLVLSTIGRLGPEVTMREVVDALQLPGSSMTSIVDRLVAEGLVERGTLPSDRRAVVATLTPAGDELVAKVEAERKKDLVVVLGDIGDEDLETYSRLLARLLEGLDRAMDDLAQHGPRAPSASRHRGLCT